MSKTHKTHCLVACCALLFSLLANGEDWPQFRGLHRDGCSPETRLLRAWPREGLKPLWTFEELGAGFSSAAIANGSVYVTGMPEGGQEGVLSCFGLDGKLRWRQAYGPEWTGTYPGPRGTPTIVGKRVFLMSGVGVVACLDAETGVLQWTRPVVQETGAETPKMGFNESLLVSDGRVFCTPGGKDAALLALDPATGKTLWNTPGFSDMSGYCSPILIERGGTRLLVTMTDASVVALKPETGKLVWRQPMDEAEADQNHAIMPVYADGRLYVTSGHGQGGRMFALSPDGRTATLQWTDTVLNTSHGGLVLANGFVYGSSAKGKWVCLDLKNGSVRYAADGVGQGSVAYADGMLYCYGEKGMLGLAKASPESLEWAGQFKIAVGSAQHWPHPSISGGRLYVRHGNALVVFDVEGGK